MVSNTAFEIKCPALQSSYPKDYKLRIKLVENPATWNPKQDWMLFIEFRCHDLLQIMRQGLFWTTSNVVPEAGWLGQANPNMTARYEWQRVWELRDIVDKPESQCRWAATVILYAHSMKTLADFRLHTLRRQNVESAVAWDKNGRKIFLYNAAPGESANNFNCLVDHLHPAYGSWWFWPFDAVLDYETVVNTGECAEKTETGSLI
jgi:hypothetical protein